MKYLALLLLSGCVAFDHAWEVDMPDFQMQRVEWHVLESPRHVANRCGIDTPRTACVIRIREGGQCIVYSIYTLERAQQIRGIDGLTVYDHEVGPPQARYGHCNGLTHPGAR